MEVELSGGRIRAADATGSVTVRTERWRPGEGAGWPGPADELVRGTTSALGFLPSHVFAERLDGEGSYEIHDVTDSVALPSGAYRVRVDGPLVVCLRFDGAAELRRESGGFTVSFDRPTAVSLGFRSRAAAPPGTVTVPRTLDGVATALSWLSTGFRSTGLDRSAPEKRGRSPRVEYGDELGIPTSLRSKRSATGVSLHLPSELEYLLPAAPLAGYLGADVRLGASEPRLEHPGGERTLARLPGFQREAADLLRETFLLDCLARERVKDDRVVGPAAALDRLGLDADELDGMRLGERLERYLDVDFAAVSDELPEWHLAMYVEPTFERVRTLPHLVSDLASVFLPESEPLGGNERLARSLDDFYRGAHDHAEVDAVKPVLGPGHIHGWLAEGVPIDVFKSVSEAYEHRDRRARRRRPDRQPISVVAVLNDTGMVEEYADLRAAYGRTVGDYGVDVEVKKRLSRDELATVFESEHDLVHYIGHCEDAGLRCTDGHLAVRDVRESNAETFLLNACGSYYEGVDLVRKGSVAGAVTFNKVLDRHAARVGTTFVRLLVNGFSIERALGLARRRIIMGKDYAVVGDGTHTIADGDDPAPADARLEDATDGGFELTYRVHDARRFGATYHPPVPGVDDLHLYGSERTVDLDAAEVREFLRTADIPVVYDGDIHWADELAAALD
jgi:hypothetical protein